MHECPQPGPSDGAATQGRRPLGKARGHSLVGDQSLRKSSGPCHPRGTRMELPAPGFSLGASDCPRLPPCGLQAGRLRMKLVFWGHPKLATIKLQATEATGARPRGTEPTSEQKTPAVMVRPGLGPVHKITSGDPPTAQIVAKNENGTLSGSKNIQKGKELQAFYLELQSRKWVSKQEVWREASRTGRPRAGLLATPQTGNYSPSAPKSACVSPSSTNQEAGRRALGVGLVSANRKCGIPPSERQAGRHGGLRAGPKGSPEAERRRRARRDQAEEEEEGQRQGEAPGSDGDEQEERGGEAALPGQADPGAGGLREDAGEAANGTDPEESIQNPQAEGGGLQQTPGHAHGALRHPQSQLDEVAPAAREGQPWRPDPSPPRPFRLEPH